MRLNSLAVSSRVGCSRIAVAAHVRLNLGAPSVKLALSLTDDGQETGAAQAHFDEALSVPLAPTSRASGSGVAAATQAHFDDALSVPLVVTSGSSGSGVAAAAQADRDKALSMPLALTPRASGTRVAVAAQADWDEPALSVSLVVPSRAGDGGMTAFFQARFFGSFRCFGMAEKVK